MLWSNIQGDECELFKAAKGDLAGALCLNTICPVLHWMVLPYKYIIAKESKCQGSGGGGGKQRKAESSDGPGAAVSHGSLQF